MSKEIKIGSLVKPHDDKSIWYRDGRLGVVIDRAEWPEDDLAGPVCYQVWWGTAGSEWWQPNELVVVKE